MGGNRDLGLCLDARWDDGLPGDIFGIHPFVDYKVCINPSIVVSEYDNYLVFALDLRKPMVHVTFPHKGTLTDYLNKIKSNPKQFTKLDELQNELGIQFTNTMIDSDVVNRFEKI
jgi:hypothetical protein